MQTVVDGNKGNNRANINIRLPDLQGKHLATKQLDASAQNIKQFWANG